MRRLIFIDDKEYILNVEKAETILDAANKVFIRYGYHKTTMDDIAQEAMIGKGTIYYYFNSKEDIFIKILEKIKDEMSSTINEKIESANTFEEKFKVYLIEPTRLFMTHYKLFIQVLNEECPVFLKKLQEFRLAALEDRKLMLLKIFEEAKEKGVLKEKYTMSYEKLINLLTKIIVYSGEHVRMNFSEDTVNDLINDYMLFSDILINGLVLQEEK